MIGLSVRAKIIFGIIAALSASIVGTATAWSVLGLPVPASRDWVEIQYGGRLKEHSTTLYEIRRGQLDREIFDLERRPSRSPDDEWRLRSLREELKKLDARQGR